MKTRIKWHPFRAALPQRQMNYIEKLLEDYKLNEDAVSMDK